MEHPDELVLKQSNREVGALVLLGAAMAAGGVVMLVLDEWKGWLVLPAGAVLAAVAIAQLLRPDELRITADGFGRRGGPLSGRGYWHRWDQVSPITVRAGRRGARAAFAPLVDEDGAPIPERGYEWTVALPSYGMRPAALSAVMNERRNIALGITASPDGPARSPATPIGAGAASGSVGDRVVSIYVEPSSDGRRPLVSGSFVPVARTLLPLRRIATRFGEEVVEGTFDGRRSPAVVIQVAGAGTVVFVRRGLGVRMLAAAGADAGSARDVVSEVVPLFGSG